jgi:hypothetical protein
VKRSPISLVSCGSLCTCKLHHNHTATRHKKPTEEHRASVLRSLTYTRRPPAGIPIQKPSERAPSSAAPIPVGMAPQVRARSSLGVSMRFCCALCSSAFNIRRGSWRRTARTSNDPGNSCRSLSSKVRCCWIIPGNFVFGTPYHGLLNLFDPIYGLLRIDLSEIVLSLRGYTQGFLLLLRNC